MNKITAKTNEARLDVFLSQELGCSRSKITNLIEKDKVLVNGLVEKAGYKVKLNDIIEWESDNEKSDLEPENIPLDIIYHDNDLAVINKPQGLVVHPGGGVNSGTLANALLYHFNTNNQDRAGIVHRLDKDTSGLMVVAKTEKAHLNLSEQFSNRTVEKIYIAIVEGVVKSDFSTIKTLIDRQQKNRKLYQVSKSSGKEAITEYKVMQRFSTNSLVEFKIITGRTHQIRVHAKYMGHPIVGDASYGYKKQRFNTKGQLLHAQSIKFIHPSLGTEMQFSASPPNDFLRIKELL